MSKIKQNSIKLLKAINQHTLDYQEDQYNMAIGDDALTIFFSTKQKEGKNLQDYTKRFRIMKDMMELHIGGHVAIFRIAGNMKEYLVTDPTNQEQCEKAAYNRYLAYKYPRNADQSKYGLLLKNLQYRSFLKTINTRIGLMIQKLLKNDQYPKTLL